MMIGKTLYAIAEALLRRRRNDATAEALMSLDDRTLEDIGVPRGRIEEAARYQPLAA